MTYFAKLYIGGCLYKTIAIKEPRDYIVIHTCPPLRLTPELPDINTPIHSGKMVFRVDYEAKRKQYEIPYVFDVAYGSVRLSQYEVHEVFPAIDRAPDENVNLDKLKEKLRSREDMTKLLLRYYRN